MGNNFKEPGQLLWAEWGLNLDEVPFEQLDHYIAVENYLMDDDDPPLDATNLENMQGYLEAFHHLCEMENWEKASEIVFLRLNTSTNEELHQQLETWGYYGERLKLYSQLIGKLKPKANAFILNRIGECYFFMGDCINAIHYQKQSFTIAKDIGDAMIKQLALISWGNIALMKGDYKKAMQLYQQCLSIARGASQFWTLALFREGKTLAMSLLWVMLFPKWDAPIARQVPDNSCLVRVLWEIGNIYNMHHKDYPKAIDYYAKSLFISKEVKDFLGEAVALKSLGNTYGLCGKYDQRIKYLKESFDIATIKIKNRKLAIHCLIDLAIIYMELEEYEQAIESINISLLINRKIHDPRQDIKCWGTLGFIYADQGNYKKPIECQERNLRIARKIQARREEGHFLGSLGKAYESLKDYPNA